MGKKFRRFFCPDITPILKSGEESSRSSGQGEKTGSLEKCMKSGVLDKKEMKFLQELLAKDEEMLETIYKI